MIRAERASLVYQDHGKQVFACREVDLDVRPNEFMGILGPSGSGKSSLLYLLSGLKDPTSGSVVFRDSDYRSMGDVARSRLRLEQFGFVFQQPFLLGYLSAIENVLLVSPTKPEAKRHAMDLLDAVGLAAKAHRFPAELSGGEKQRVCVARALFSDPAAIFADEPTASLDHASGAAVIQLLVERRQGALVVVTHDPTMLEQANRVFMMEDGLLKESLEFDAQARTQPQ